MLAESKINVGMECIRLLQFRLKLLLKFKTCNCIIASLILAAISTMFFNIKF